MKRDDYTVGWISALPEEQAATLLDDYHDKLPIGRYEPTYILGRIGDHHVVIACLSTVGTNSAARCAARLQSGFQSLRFILMVGIGGGVPTRHDIRLGDVVVSVPGKCHRGVVQYDLGTKYQNEELVTRDTQQLNRPPDLLLTAVEALRILPARGGAGSDLGQRLSDYAESVAKEYGHLSYSRRPEVDTLFEADYLHPNADLTCEACACDLERVVSRPPRGDNKPQIHRGLIASGNAVLRDAIERDRLANKLDVLCFEMEAGGLMKDIGCLIIRGICDYCDSHKNKDWQGYAAAVAAGYGRELLKVIPGLQEDRKTPIRPELCFGNQIINMSGNHTTSGGKSFIGGTFTALDSINF